MVSVECDFRSKSALLSVADKQKNVLKNPRQFVQNVSYTTSQKLSKIIYPGNVDTDFVLIRTEYSRTIKKLEVDGTIGEKPHDE